MNVYRKVNKIKFYESLEALVTEANLNNKRAFKQLFTETEYKTLLKEIDVARNKSGVKTARQYYLLKTYEILEVAGVQKIIVKRDEKNQDIKYLSSYDELFDSIDTCHQNVGHKGIFLIFVFLALISECFKNK